MAHLEGAARAVDGQLLVVGAQAVALGVLVAEQARLQHLVVAGQDACTQIGKRPITI